MGEIIKLRKPDKKPDKKKKRSRRKTAKVIAFSGPTALDIPAEKVLEAAIANKLGGVVVMGYTQDGTEYIYSSIASGAEVLWLVEVLKKRLLSLIE